jgi:hypothetical protein
LKNTGLPPQLKTSVIVLAALLGCVNRGQHAPSDGGGNGGAGGGAGGGDAGAVDSHVDMRGNGGGGGTNCVPDAGPDAASCKALFNFESCNLHGASLNDPSGQIGFKSFVLTSSQTFCGGGALQIEVNVSNEKDAGLVGHGELFLPVGGMDLSGKTLTVHVMADPATPNTIRFNVIPVTPNGYGPTSIGISPIPAQWTTRSFAFATVDSGVNMVDRLSIQVNNASGSVTPEVYVGTLYIDEIDISPTPTDGGTSDGGVPDVRTDVPDAGADARDAPAGS